jgi:stearoyl-CoA desaturase (delta-9 desaturase)
MAFIDTILKAPSYGWMNEQGGLIKPSVRQLFSEFFSRINIFKSRKNWLPMFSWLSFAVVGVPPTTNGGARCRVKSTMS